MGTYKSFTEASGLPFNPVSVDPYHSIEYFEKEREKIFARSWLSVGRVEEIPKPGDYMLRDIEICKAQIIVSRDKSGAINAYHNVCPHRGNLVMKAREGNASLFVCGYHSWTFGLDGRLRGIPDEAGFPMIDKKTCRLKRVSCELWNGFIFISLAEPADVTLKEFLGDMGELLDGMVMPFADNPIVLEATLQANWKVVMDAFSESYHVSSVHPTTIKDSFIWSGNPHGRAMEMEFLGLHRRSIITGNPGFALGPHQKIAALAAADDASAVSTTGNVFGGESMTVIAAMMEHPSINAIKADTWVNDLNMLFPNFHIDPSPGGFWTHQFWPIAPNRTRWVSNWYVPRPTTVRERFQQELYLANLAEIMVEDIGTTERVQRGIESGAQPYFHLGDPDALIRHSLDQAQRFISAPSVSAALKDSGQ